MASRPRLKPYFRPLRRGPDAVQLGLSAASGGVVLCGLDRAEVAFLARLDGTLTEADLVRGATAHGVDPQRAAALVALLRAHHLLDRDLDEGGPDRVDLARARGAQVAAGSLHPGDGSTRAPVDAWPPPAKPAAARLRSMPGERARGASTTDRLLSRAGRRVAVAGAGRMPWAIGNLLRESGIGRVDLGRAALDALDQALRSDPGGPAPDLVVLVGDGVVDASAGEPWRRRRVPTLPVVLEARRVVVGPLIDDQWGPCLHCLDLERADRDVVWPALVAQVHRGPTSSSTDPDGDSTLTAMASGVVGMVVHSHLSGEGPPPGISIEVSLPWPRLDHRRWPRHPACAAHPSTPRTDTGSPPGRWTPGSAAAPASGSVAGAIGLGRE